MKALLVTSRVHFVPENYDEFVLPLLASPHVGGLLVVDNRTPDLIVKAAALIATGAGPGFGAQLLKNYFGDSQDQRRKTAETHGKPMLTTAAPGKQDALDWIQQNGFNIILHARTRHFFGTKLLQSVPLGAINIHHGLLPDQRGLMCDFWALTEGRTAGFSVHVMTKKLDDGPILRAVPVPYRGKNYREYLRQSTALEKQTCLELLQFISENGTLPPSVPNESAQPDYRSNPGLLDFYRMKF